MLCDARYRLLFTLCSTYVPFFNPHLLSLAALGATAASLISRMARSPSASLILLSGTTAHLQLLDAFLQLPSVRQAQPVEHSVRQVRVHPELGSQVQQAHKLVYGPGPPFPQPSGCSQLGLIQVKLQNP